LPVNSQRLVIVKLLGHRSRAAGVVQGLREKISPPAGPEGDLAVSMPDAPGLVKASEPQSPSGLASP
jgi:hypothetical protein